MNADTELNFRFEQLTIHSINEKHIFDVEIAETAIQRRHGLQYRKSLPLNSGMLFIFETVKPITMWMKNTIISLDMLFISAEGEIIKIVNNTIPFSLNPIFSGIPVKGVLELSAGSAKRLKIRIGDRVYITVL